MFDSNYGSVVIEIFNVQQYEIWPWNSGQWSIRVIESSTIRLLDMVSY